MEKYQEEKRCRKTAQMKTTKTDIPCKKLICRKSKGKIVKYAQKLKNGGSKYSLKNMEFYPIL